MKKEEKKLISLKEAAQISGYAPDYVGQLIRSGKIEGKQVYHSVAWMTTEEAVREYVEKTMIGTGPGKGPVVQEVRRMKVRLADALSPNVLFRVVFILALSLLTLFALFLFYILSVNLDKNLERRTLERANEATATVPRP
jgi:hypothetical protein